MISRAPEPAPGAEPRAATPADGRCGLCLGYYSDGCFHCGLDRRRDARVDPQVVPPTTTADAERFRAADEVAAGGKYGELGR